MTVYLDLFVLLNFLVDFLLLMAANRLSGCPPQTGRAAAAALLGGVYAGVCMLPQMRFLGGIFWRIVSLGAMAVLSFGWNRGAFRRGVLFILLSMALGGIAMGTRSSGTFGLILSALVLAVLCRAGFRGSVPNGEMVDVQLCCRGRQVRSVALRDTGNTLRDPLTGEQVLVAEADVAEKLIGLTREQLASPLETLMSGKIPGLRLIPYRAVGQPGAMLLAVRCEEAKIGTWHGKCIVAFSPERLGTSGTYQLLVGGAI